MVVAVIKTKAYTADEYLTLEIESDIRHEYHNGEIITVPGDIPTHNQIAVVINALLWFALRGKDFCIFNADQRLSIPDRNIYTYPDVMVTSRPYELQPGRKDTMIFMKMCCGRGMCDAVRHESSRTHHHLSRAMSMVALSRISQEDSSMSF
jgi:hypothetical protein